MKHLLQYLGKYFYKYRVRFGLGLCFIFLSNYFLSLQPQVIRQALDMVIENIALYRMYEGFSIQTEVFRHFGKVLLFFGLLVVGLALLMGTFLFMVRQTVIVMSRLIEYDMRKEIFQHYEDLHLAFYKKNKTGDLMSRVVEDVSKVRMFLGPAVLYGINLIALFTLVIWSMIRVSPELTLYCLAPLPVLSFTIFQISKLIHRHSTAIQKQLSNLTSITQEVYSGIRVVKSYTQEPATANFFQEESQNYMDRSLDLARVNAFFHPTMIVLIGLSTVITVYFGGIQVARGNITTGNIAEFIIYVNMLTWPVTSLGWISSLIQQAAASQERINEFLAEKPQIVNPVSTSKAVEMQGAVAFEDVSFTYPDTGIKGLEKVSFKLAAFCKVYS